jgi:SSS family solute:Na+ symporter
MFPSWFVGFAFAAIAISALVPAAIMSIAAANLWTRNIYKAYLNPNATPLQETKHAKNVSLIVKVFALAFIVFLPTQYAINLQLLGGVWILQTFPTVICGLYTRWFHHLALTIGWLIAMLLGTIAAFARGLTATYPVHLGGFSAVAYIAVEALLVNLVVAAVLTPLFDRAGIPRGRDITAADHYDDPPEPQTVIPTTPLGEPAPV